MQKQHISASFCNKLEAVVEELTELKNANA